MAFDAVANFILVQVQTPPAPTTSGTSLTLVSGQGATLPNPATANYNMVVWPNPQTLPTTANAEIVRVTGLSTDTLTITRTQESTSARQILAGDYMALCVTAKTITDLQTALNNVATATTITTGTDNSAIVTALALANATVGKLGAAFTSYNPTITAGSGTITAYTATGYYFQLGKIVIFYTTIAITNNGTGSVGLYTTLPTTPKRTSSGLLVGKEWNITGKTITGADLGNPSYFTFYDNSYPGGTGSNQMDILVIYETA